MWIYPHTGRRSAARIRELTRFNTCLNFRDEVRPRDKLRKQTKISVKRRKRRRWAPRRTTSQRSVVRIARSSSTSMCSPECRHCHPVTSFHRHNFPGTLERSLWNLTFNSNGFSKLVTKRFVDSNGGRSKMPCKVVLPRAS